MITLHPDYAVYFKDLTSVDDFLEINAELARDFKNRKTGRFERDGKGFYIKKHFECGVGFILDELFHLRKPHIGACHEWRVLNGLHEIGIDSMRPVAFGQEGQILTRQRSFLVTEELKQVQSMANVCAAWPASPPAVSFKKALLETIAGIARKLHESGINHRDFYLCHFLLDTSDLETVEAGERPPRLYLMDLHRAQQRANVPFRWRVKDIGGLYFSAMDIGLTRCDLFRFMRLYTGKPLRQTLQEDRRFWQAVRQRAIRTYRRDFGQKPKYKTTKGTK
jgi:heptose I phosphotransferase